MPHNSYSETGVVLLHSCCLAAVPLLKFFKFQVETKEASGWEREKRRDTKEHCATTLRISPKLLFVVLLGVQVLNASHVS